MTTTSNARTFKPIFTAAITPASVSTRAGKNGKYAIMQGATVEQGDKDPITRTVMAFGKIRDEVASKLRKGRRVELAVQYDRGTLRVVGFPRAKAQPAAAA